ncbi:MAG: PPOX class F420-dependent oxidoreductase [Dehalococcoidia bacterium]
MAPSEIDQYLRGKRIAVIATIRRDGSPHLTSMWYGYDGETITFNPGRDSVKVRNVQRDNRVSVMVDVDEEPYKGVRIEGTAVVEETGVREKWYDIARRYLGDEGGRKYVEENDDGNGVILRVTPQRYYSWDYSK